MVIFPSDWTERAFTPSNITLFKLAPIVSESEKAKIALVKFQDDPSGAKYKDSEKVGSRTLTSPSPRPLSQNQPAPDPLPSVPVWIRKVP